MNDLVLDELDHRILRGIGRRLSFHPFGEVICGYNDEPMSFRARRVNHAYQIHTHSLNGHDLTRGWSSLVGTL